MSDNLINRQDAIEIIQSMYPGMPRVPWMRKDWQKRYEPYIRMENAIRKLPSTQPELVTVNIDHELTQEEYKKLRKDMANAPIMLLPSAEPEIIRCKDCKHYQFADNRAFGMPVKMCKWFGFEDVDDDDFCSRAERRSR